MKISEIINEATGGDEITLKKACAVARIRPKKLLEWVEDGLKISGESVSRERLLHFRDFESSSDVRIPTLLGVKRIVRALGGDYESINQSDTVFIWLCGAKIGYYKGTDKGEVKEFRFDDSTNIC